MSSSTELLEKQLSTLESELSRCDEEAGLAVAGQGERELTFDAKAWRDRKPNLKEEIRLTEVLLLQSRIPELKQVYVETKSKRDGRQQLLNAKAKRYHKKEEELRELFEDHALTQAELYRFDQTILQTVDAIAADRRRLKELISELLRTDADADAKLTDNRLIRN